MDGGGKPTIWFRIMESSIRSRKWTQYPVFHLIDLAVVNNWLEYTQFQKAQKSKNSMDSLTFRLEVAESMVMSKEATLMRRGRPRSVPLTNNKEEKINGFYCWAVPKGDGKIPKTMFCRRRRLFCLLA
ncbi:hypothetical protein QYM36_007542 [Artemia franciscana]|uniref:PiggyBac transposable element-derived protein domain-containing protein n=1 Tax=Artemia franciscana TaxID=6661 RepID=A0AA88IEP0_ARTSF|nr:hypothetical protein QYM36_007542 [Artemia franciscana]